MCFLLSFIYFMGFLIVVFVLFLFVFGADNNKKTNVVYKTEVLRCK